MEFVQVMQLKMSAVFVKVTAQKKILIVMAIVQLISIVMENVAQCDAIEDECGVCEGDGSSCSNNDGECSDDADVCLTLNGGNLLYSSTSDIGGFQFSHNGCVSGASGGDAAANGFTVSASGTTVLAFSFTGSVVPAGEGTLVELSGDISEDCLYEYIFSDISGSALSVEFATESADDGGDDGGEASCPEGTQVCLSLDSTNLNYSSTEDIAGFQFFHNGCVEGASGGDAAANGFTVSASGSTVLAFSFTGSVVPALVMEL